MKTLLALLLTATAALAETQFTGMITKTESGLVLFEPTPAPAHPLLFKSEKLQAKAEGIAEALANQKGPFPLNPSKILVIFGEAKENNTILVSDIQEQKVEFPMTGKIVPSEEGIRFQPEKRKGTLYKITTQDPLINLDSFQGKTSIIAGSIQGDTISIVSIQEAPKQTKKK